MTLQHDKLREIVMTPQLDARIRAALASKKLSSTALDILHILDASGYPRVGRSNATSIKEIQHTISISWGRCKSPSDRSIKMAVKELIEQHEIPIGSIRKVRGDAPHGYFFIISPADAEAAIGPLLSEIKSLARRIRILSPDSEYMRRLSGQIGLGEES